jgi:hypothetical protein
MSVDLLKISKSLFTDRKNWKLITDEEKELSFFVVNRNFSKKFPHFSKLLNHKMIDKVSAMDTWYYYSNNLGYPNWFWFKYTNKKEKSDKDIEDLKSREQLTDTELDLINRFYKEDLDFELDLIKKEKKNNK